MSAQLPYLPPIDPYKNTRATVGGVADDVRAVQGGAATAGQMVRGVARVGAAAAGDTASAVENARQAAVNAAVVAPADAIRDTAGTFFRNVFNPPAVANAPPPPATIGLPQLSTPGTPVATGGAPSAAIPVAPVLPSVPATQAPVSGTPAAPAASATPAAPPTTAVSALPGHDTSYSGSWSSLRPDPIAQQQAYARAGQDHIMDVAHELAKNNPEQRALYLRTALGQLSSLAGVNNFASVQGQLQASQEQTAEQERANVRNTDAQRYNTDLVTGEAERANIRTTGEQRHATDVSAENIRKNAGTVVIGHDINPAGPAFPTIPRMGVLEKDEKGNTVLTDMQGNRVGPGAVNPAAPATRAEFISKAKQANPDSSEADLGAYYDKKYGGKK
jgi:hypothetical protein